MITHIKIQGFKSLLDVDLELGSVNVFVGANGSGKSNLLEALGVLGAAAHGNVEPETLRYRGVRVGAPASYKSSFREEPSKRLAFNVEWGTSESPVEGLSGAETSHQSKYSIAFENLLGGFQTRLSISPDARSLLQTDLPQETHWSPIPH